MGQQKVLWSLLRREISGATEARAEALKTGSHTVNRFPEDGKMGGNRSITIRVTISCVILPPDCL